MPIYIDDGKNKTYISKAFLQSKLLDPKASSSPIIKKSEDSGTDPKKMSELELLESKMALSTTTYTYLELISMLTKKIISGSIDKYLSFATVDSALSALYSFNYYYFLAILYLAPSQTPDWLLSVIYDANTRESKIKEALEKEIDNADMMAGFFNSVQQIPQKEMCKSDVQSIKSSRYVLNYCESYEKYSGVDSYLYMMLYFCDRTIFVNLLKRMADSSNMGTIGKILFKLFFGEGFPTVMLAEYIFVYKGGHPTSEFSIKDMWDTMLNQPLLKAASDRALSYKEGYPDKTQDMSDTKEFDKATTYAAGYMTGLASYQQFIDHFAIFLNHISDNVTTNLVNYFTGTDSVIQSHSLDSMFCFYFKNEPFTEYLYNSYAGSKELDLNYQLDKSTPTKTSYTGKICKYNIPNYKIAYSNKVDNKETWTEYSSDWKKMLDSDSDTYKIFGGILKVFPKLGYYSEKNKINEYLSDYFLSWDSSYHDHRKSIFLENQPQIMSEFQSIYASTADISKGTENGSAIYHVKKMLGSGKPLASFKSLFKKAINLELSITKLLRDMGSGLTFAKDNPDSTTEDPHAFVEADEFGRIYKTEYDALVKEKSEASAFLAAYDIDTDTIAFPNTVADAKVLMQSLQSILSHLRKYCGPLPAGSGLARCLAPMLTKEERYSLPLFLALSYDYASWIVDYSDKSLVWDLTSRSIPESNPYIDDAYRYSMLYIDTCAIVSVIPTFISEEFDSSRYKYVKDTLVYYFQLRKVLYTSNIIIAIIQYLRALSSDPIVQKYSDESKRIYEGKEIDGMFTHSQNWWGNSL